jgi:hypothetical protein
VDQPEPATGWSSAEQRSIANAPVPASSPADPAIPAVAEAEPPPENHQRLNHTVTLGEVNVSPPSDQPPSPYGPNVSVTINNYGSAGGSAPGYAGYYGGYAGFATARGGSYARASSVTGASRASGSAMQAGQNWPSIADHGSSFPYRSAPASPWR